MEQIKNIAISPGKPRPIVVDIFYKDTGKAKPIVIFSHGFKGFKDWGTFNLIAERFAEEGFVFIKFNFPYNGMTPDALFDFVDLEAFSENNFSREIEDLDEVISWTLKTDLIPDYERDADRLYLMGHSRGGGISVIKTAEDERVSKLVTWAAVSDFGAKWPASLRKEWKKKGVMYVANTRTGQEMPMKYQLIEDLEKNMERLDVVQAAARISVPFMAIHGTEDESVPFEDAIAMKRVNKAVKLNLIPNAGHTFEGKHPYNKKRLPDDTELVVRDSLKFFKKK